MAKRPKPPTRRELDDRRALAEAEAIEARRVALMDQATGDIVRRDEVLRSLKVGAAVTFKHLLVPHPTLPGRYALKPLEEIPDEVAWAIQSMSIRDTIDGQTIDIKLVDRVRIYEQLGKYLGMWTAGDVHTHQHVHLQLTGVPDDQLVARLRKLEAQEGAA